MNIEITATDIEAWLELAKTNVTMRSLLVQCATTYALIEPELTTMRKERDNLSSRDRMLGSLIRSQQRP